MKDLLTLAPIDDTAHPAKPLVASPNTPDIDNDPAWAFAAATSPLDAPVVPGDDGCGGASSGYVSILAYQNYGFSSTYHGIGIFFYARYKCLDRFESLGSYRSAHVGSVIQIHPFIDQYSLFLVNQHQRDGRNNARRTFLDIISFHSSYMYQLQSSHPEYPKSLGLPMSAIKAAIRAWWKPSRKPRVKAGTRTFLRVYS